MKQPPTLPHDSARLGLTKREYFAAVMRAWVTLYAGNFSRQDAVNLLRVLKGSTWLKEKCGETKLNYTTKEPVVGGRKIRLWMADPPGTCRMVEERVVIPAVPAQPAHIGIRHVMRCTPEAEAAPASAGFEDSGAVCPEPAEEAVV